MLVSEEQCPCLTIVQSDSYKHFSKRNRLIINELLGFEVSDSNFPIGALGNFESEEPQLQFENFSFEGKLRPFKSNGITLM